MIDAIDLWHKTRAGYAAFALFELALVYAFGALAIDRGNPLYYLAAILFLAGAGQNIWNLAQGIRK